MGPFSLLILIISSDFPISTAYDDQYHPAVIFANEQYCVFWQDYRHYSPDRSIYGARVAVDGVVLDPDGELVFRDKVAALDVGYDGTNFLVVVQDSC